MNALYYFSTKQKYVLSFRHNCRSNCADICKARKLSKFVNIDCRGPVGDRLDRSGLGRTPCLPMMHSRVVFRLQQIYTFWDLHTTCAFGSGYGVLSCPTFRSWLSHFLPVGDLTKCKIHSFSGVITGCIWRLHAHRTIVSYDIWQRWFKFKSTNQYR